ncbi:T9SS type A sorting domain-containing protein [uncultured Cytophaga sp.]|uniref:T9SS type A sorting domain-containing protein n=1 Tax=uncultured Cytophaga sp. TaxID=160238 RepID=UPI00261F40B5|nr:T9SS type A sorting domain-containing protein [uncultured Cytophaga sp.]
MKKNNFRFFIKLFFIASLIITTHLNAYSVSLGCKDVAIDGPDRVCSPSNNYSLNYDNVRCITWKITGGEITEIGGKNIQDFIIAHGYLQPFDFSNGALAITEFEYCKGGWGRIGVTPAGQPEFFLDVGPTIAAWFISFTGNPATDIKVKWNSQSYYHSLTAKGEGLSAFGRCGKGEATKNITFASSIPNFTLTAPKIDFQCNEGVQISGAPNGGTSYAWYAPGATVQNNWNTGIYISGFTQVGNVPIAVVVTGQCNTVTKYITLNIIQPDFGHVQQNGANVDDPGTLVSLDCQGSFNLGMSKWVSNNAIYTWELPGNQYDDQTNTYNKTIISGINKQNVQGKLPTGGLTDFVGKVTITGVCGAPVVRTFIIRPTLRPTVDADIYSCSNSVLINVNNPTANGNINAWVAPTYPTVGYGTFVNPTPNSVQFTASNPGAYLINIGVNGAGGCYTQLQTTVHAVSASGNTNAGTSGWQSGVLSDNRKAPGSNLAPYGGNIYFAGRDGKIYFYSYSAALQKWVINQLPGISNAAIPAAGAFTKIGVATLSGLSYLYYTENSTGKLWKIDLATNSVTPGLSLSINVSDFMTMGNDVYAIEKGTNALYSNNVSISNVGNVSLKAIMTGNGVVYLQNNNLYSTTLGQLTFTNDVYASSDVVVLGSNLYYARGQKGTANLFRLPLSSNPNPIEQITTTSNLSGVFTINLATGVIYYGVLNSGAINTTTTVASGVYKSANIYQASLSGTTWTFNAATTVKPWEGLDMYIQSPIYSGNHVYYIGAGHNNVIKTAYELEVWNLYYENACAPVLQRVAADDTNVETEKEVLLYPNPFNTQLSVDLSAYTEDGKQTSVAIEVIDATGKTIYKSTVLSELNTISTTDWAQGMYVVKIRHNNSLINKKVVKY